MTVLASERSKKLYEKREKLKKGNQDQYDELQQEIKKSRLQDFKEWVEEHSQKMQVADGQGDIKKIYKSVNTLSGERKSPPKNLTTNGQGKILTSAQEVSCKSLVYLFISKVHNYRTRSKKTRYAETTIYNRPRPTIHKGGASRAEEDEV